MTLYSIKGIYRDAKLSGYAIPAFNIHNLETIKAVIEVADELDSPIIIAATPGTVRYAGAEYLSALGERANEKSRVPIILHLDHAESFEQVKECIDVGFNSVMIDGSHLSYHENVKLVKEVVEYAHRHDCFVEAELGVLGGIEDDLNVSESDVKLTDPKECISFVEETGIDSLAVAIGTAHGLYDEEPKIDFERLKLINECVDIPLVLHGASGVPNGSVEAAINRGICKVNIATELKEAFAGAVREYLHSSPNESDPRRYLTPGIKAMKSVVRDKIMLCNSVGRSF